MFIAIGEDHDVIGAYVPSSSLVPNSMDESGTTEDQEGIPVPVVPKADVMDALGHFGKSKMICITPLDPKQIMKK